MSMVCRYAPHALASLAGLVLIVGCVPEDRTGVDSGNDTLNPTTEDGMGDGDGDGDGDGGGDTNGDKLDSGIDGDAPIICVAPDHVACDNMDDDEWHALGINCPGEHPFEIEPFGGHWTASYVHDGPLGTQETWKPKEGEKFLVLSTGDALDILEVGAEGDTTHPENDPGTLPMPLQAQDVHDTNTCIDDPNLIGDGDCSNTIQDQLENTNGAFDYAEMRFSTTVPASVTGFTFNFAFMSFEYPDFYQWDYNDMFVAWLNSEKWTGNVSFDQNGEPISLNAGFLNYKDAPNIYDCPPPCEAPELDGTAMVGHAASSWLETNVEVAEGEQIEFVMAIFDVNDNLVDSLVLLDNFLWSCDGSPPETIPG